MDGAADDRARYWGALNEIRRQSEHNHARTTAWEKSQYQGIGIASVVVLGLGILTAAGLAALLVFDGTPGPGDPAWIAYGLLGLIPALFLSLGVLFRVRWRWWLANKEAYGRRQEVRDAHQKVLADLAERWDGTVSTGGVRESCRFLLAHWPDQAHRILITPIGGEQNDRLTLRATRHGRPVLLLVIDLLAPVHDFTPPVLAAFVACPLDPDGAAEPPGETPPGRRLTERGFRVRWTRAGVSASHAGPAHALLTVESLEEVMEQLERLCREAPAGEPIEEPAPVARAVSANGQQTAEYFLKALKAGDGAGALVYTDSSFSAGRWAEMSPSDLDKAIDGNKARPISWRLAGNSSAGDNRSYRFKAVIAHRPADELTVHVSWAKDRWHVCGYAVGVKLIIGIEHDI